MTGQNMKRLGDYIRPVDVRNRDLKVTRLMGINIEKRFMPSVANVVGTDLSNYKVVSKGQFACNLMHVGRDEKIPVALQKDDEPIIVSPAYVVFEVVDTNVLLTEYLMMWFSRSEFDRNAWFYTDGDVRGGMDREALFDMQIPVPTIEKQREIVAEYNTLATRIETNKKLIATLEQTAQTSNKPPKPSTATPSSTTSTPTICCRDGNTNLFLILQKYGMVFPLIRSCFVQILR
ncbi:hypothetical protein [uncultured Methanobrevibacter sp.]|uniref:hypothetical protein n=1 Tax=uncultured Methanobrevibacter sp. TaxID=253161 RepID=UPI0025CC3397|nr:hypothetical protein [uncultured Methanobrevibacter sp.]